MLARFFLVVATLILSVCRKTIDAAGVKGAYSSQRSLSGGKGKGKGKGKKKQGDGCPRRWGKAREDCLIAKTEAMLNALWDRNIEAFVGPYAPGYTHLTNGQDKGPGFFLGVTDAIYNVLDFTTLRITHTIASGNDVAMVWDAGSKLPLGPGDPEEDLIWYEQWFVTWNDDGTHIIALEELENAESRERRLVGLALSEAAACDLCDGSDPQLEGCEEAFEKGFCT